MRRLFIAFVLLGLSSPLFAVEPTPPVSFALGVDYRNACPDVDPRRACDQSNLINDRFGAVQKRGGSKFYISQAASSEPVNSLFRMYISSNNNTIKCTYMTTADRIYYSSTTPPQWSLLKAGLAGRNQRFTFATMNNLVIMTGDQLTDPIYKHDILRSSFTELLVPGATDFINLRARRMIVAKNYLVLGDVLDVSSAITTYSPNQINYSLLVQPSSFTIGRFIRFGGVSGGKITGFSMKNGNLEVYQESAIHDISFTALNLRAEGGDQVVTQNLVDGFGCIAPDTLINTGPYDIFLSKDGLLKWDGGRRSRLNIAEEMTPISTLIQPVIDRIINSGTYRNARAIYYPKRQWIVFSYEDPTKFPKGIPNSSMSYDIITGEWQPFNGWIASSLERLDGPGDNGELMYGGAEGHTYLADQTTASNDERKEIVVDSMDSATGWTSANAITSPAIEGAGALRMTFSASQTSMTKVALINAGEWYDKSPVATNDKLSFKVYPSSVQNIMWLRVDLLFENNPSSFTVNFSSISLSSSSLTAGNAAWTTVEVALSSFPKQASWDPLVNENVPFPNSLTYYGLRFVSSSTADASIVFDDVRIVGRRPTPLNAFRLTPQFDFGTKSMKDFRQVILTAEKPKNSSIFVDVINDFGKVSITHSLKSIISNEIVIYGMDNRQKVAVLDGTTFEEITSTDSGSVEVADFMQGASDSRYIYAGDRTYSRLAKIDKSSMTVFVSTYGSLGTGTSNFDIIHQIAIDKDNDNLYVIDNGNNRLKVHSQKTLAYIRSFGSLGTGTTNLYSPTGVANDEDHIWIGDDGNSRVLMLSKSTFGFVSSLRFDDNTFGEKTLAADSDNLFIGYNKISDNSAFYQDVILEKRAKSPDMSLVNRVVIRPDNSVAASTYAIRGDIALLGNFIFITFTDDINQNGYYYIQKRLKDDFSLVDEYRTQSGLFSVSADGKPYEPSTQIFKQDLKTKQGVYLQLRYRDSGLTDNDFRLLNQAFVYEKLDYRESD